jgi:hypothetical protein
MFWKNLISDIRNEDREREFWSKNNEVEEMRNVAIFHAKTSLRQRRSIFYLPPVKK